MITIKNANWEVIKTIEADLKRTIYRQLQKEWVELPSACFTWICGACICEIESWSENIEKDYKWEPGFPLAQEEVMTCIAWVKNKDIDIVLRTMF